MCLKPFLSASLTIPSSNPEISDIALLKCLIESSSNESIDFGGRLQNQRRASPFKLCAKSLHIISSSMPVGMHARDSLGQGRLTDLAYIILRIIVLMFIIPRGTRSSGIGEAALEPRGCEQWLVSLEDSRVWLVTSPRCSIPLSILHTGCSSISRQHAWSLWPAGWRFGRLLWMLKLPAEYWDCLAIVPPAVRGCSTWLLCESSVYDGQGTHDGRQTVDTEI
ncbi:hypothetical protein TIFTF001_033997 [Ficus carica]|uniref:Uncharacterized protein n=1 Tax=Ficus carica TaxID=3494 RepID=A0AA88J4J2_FICCA|nr:hypothetical protein TIFTF001_033997 [Ficus carica]